MIICSGNPKDKTVASAISKIYPFAHFASRSTGYDLRFWTPGSEDYFREQLPNYSIFINSSFICGGGQLTLLETTHEVWSKNDIKGHIINIGSSAENIGVNDPKVHQDVYGIYSIQKRSLRDRSLQLNGKNGIKTTHVVAGGLDDGRPENKECLNLDNLAQIIKWIIENPNNIPIIGIEK